MVEALDDLGVQDSEDLIDKGGHPAEPGDTASGDIIEVNPGTVGDFVEDQESYGGDPDQDAIQVVWESPWMTDEDDEPYERSAFLNITYGEDDEGNKKVSKQCQLGQFVHSQGSMPEEGEEAKIQAYRGDDGNVYEELFTGN